jgi:ribosome biogenesis GTPase
MSHRGGIEQVDLVPLGWSSFFTHYFESLAKQGLVPARIVREDRQLYTVLCEAGELMAEVSGRMRHEARSRSDWPAVGDWVAIQPRTAEQKATIHALLPRRSRISRKVAGERTEEQVVAANVDTVFLVSGLDGDFNLRRIERALAMAWESGVNPVIVLNKADVAPRLEQQVAAAERIAMGVPVHVVSAETGMGLEAMAAYVGPGQTAVLVGSSGVGKSSLINRLLDSERQKVYAVREDDSRGRHTTTRRELLFLPDGGMIIDSPGIRELQLWGGEEGNGGEGLAEMFEDIEALAAQCRFHDCQHEREPGCAIRAALEAGQLDPGRLKSYAKMQKELTFLARRVDERARAEAKERSKRLSQFGKVLKKSGGKYG